MSSDANALVDEAGLGLKRRTVALSEHSPTWEDAFREERAVLADALSAVPCEIEHIGSTAVPGLKAKPILDIAIGVAADSPIEECIPLIEAPGYLYQGESADVGHVLVREAGHEIRTHHVHVVRLGDFRWDRWLTLRDYLRRSAEARKSYTAAKLELARLHPSDRKAYTDGNSDVINRLVAQARVG